MTEPPRAGSVVPPQPGQPGDAAPLLLFPVRIETRFVDSDAGSDLYVRVYPDQVLVNGHHPELTPAELAAGNAYWDALWRAGNPPPQQDSLVAPWRGLAARYGAPRAAWIVRQTTPVNLAQRPAAPTADGQQPIAGAGAAEPAGQCRLLAAAGDRRPAAPGVDGSAGRERHHGEFHRRADHRRTWRCRCLRPARPRPAASRTGCQWMRACAGWSTSTPRWPAGWRCASRSPRRSAQAGFDRILVYGTAAVQPDGAAQDGPLRTGRSGRRRSGRRSSGGRAA